MPGAPGDFVSEVNAAELAGPSARRKRSTQANYSATNRTKGGRLVVRSQHSHSSGEPRLRNQESRDRQQLIDTSGFLSGCTRSESATGITRVGLSELLQIGLCAGLQLPLGLAGRSKHAEVILESWTHAAPALVLRAQGFFDNVIDRSHLKGVRHGRSSGDVQSTRLQVRNCWRRHHPRATSGSDLRAFSE